MKYTPVEASRYPHLRLTSLECGLEIRFAATSQVSGNAIRELYEASMQALNQGAEFVVVNLEGIGLATSGLLGMLVTIRKKAMAGAVTFVVACPDPNIRQSFVITKLHHLIKLVDSREAAYQHVGLAPPPGG